MVVILDWCTAVVLVNMLNYLCSKRMVFLISFLLHSSMISAASFLGGEFKDNESSPDLSCPNEGHFPHPTNASQYYICFKGHAQVYSCTDPSLRCYNSKSERCDSTYPYYCTTFKCQSKHNVKVPHPRDENFFAYCMDGSVFHVDQCPGSYALNKDTQRCEPTCKVVGYIPDAEDTSGYYFCSYATSSATELSLARHSCPHGHHFNSVQLSCARK